MESVVLLKESNPRWSGAIRLAEPHALFHCTAPLFTHSRRILGTSGTLKSSIHCTARQSRNTPVCQVRAPSLSKASAVVVIGVMNPQSEVLPHPENPEHRLGAGLKVTWEVFHIRTLTVTGDLAGVSAL